jgi:phospholipid/cholesterol/gamma-HCH transport system substrate-binding protein
MKISNETKVGVLTVFALTILILGYNFLKGKDILKKNKKVYAVFSEIGSLEKSNDVKLKGNPIGKVYDIRFTDENADSILVVINLTTGVRIPTNAVASITSPLAGTAYIVVDFPADSGEVGKPRTFLGNEDTIRTSLNPGFLGDLNSQVTPTLEKARRATDSLTAVLSSVNRFLDPQTKNNIHSIVENLVKSSSELQALLSTENGMLAHSLANMNEVTGNLKKNNDTITAILHNTKTVTEKLAALEMKPITDSLQATVNQLNAIAVKLNSNNGTLGALMNDRQLYDRFKNTALGLEILLDDIRAHPKRYVNVSVFGKKDKGNYLTSPIPKKDSLP